MKHRLVLSLASLALVAAAVGVQPARAQSLSGTWTITSEGRRGPMTQTLTLTQDGSSLSGTISFMGGGRRGGGAGRGPAAVAISDGSVEGSAFRFTLVLDFQGNSFSMRYSGTVSGDAIEGTIENDFGAQPFRGTRAS